MGPVGILPAVVCEDTAAGERVGESARLVATGVQRAGTPVSPTGKMPVLLDRFESELEIVNQIADTFHPDA
jgi:hypothetical protein